MTDDDPRSEIRNALAEDDIARAQVLIRQWVNSRFPDKSDRYRSELAALTLKRAVALAAAHTTPETDQ